MFVHYWLSLLAWHAGWWWWHGRKRCRWHPRYWSCCKKWERCFFFSMHFVDFSCVSLWKYCSSNAICVKELLNRERQWKVQVVSWYLIQLGDIKNWFYVDNVNISFLVQEIWYVFLGQIVFTYALHTNETFPCKPQLIMIVGKLDVHWLSHISCSC